MSAHDFEAALEISDDDAACKRLYQLVSKGKITSSSALLGTAQTFLATFCDTGISVLRRRWVGLALASMIEASSKAALQLRHAATRLSNLGAIVVGPAEAEATKIIAGLIMSTGIAQGLAYSEFWEMDKLRNTVSYFPDKLTATWIKGFEDYMEALSSLKLEDAESKPVILYPVAVHASDGLRQTSGDEVIPLLLIEGQRLTIITMGSRVHEIEFVDIPVSSVHSGRCQPSELHDSQNRQTEVEPWEVVLEIKQAPIGYRVNCSERSGKMFTIILSDRNDAEVCLDSMDEITVVQGRSTDEAVGKSSAGIPKKLDLISKGEAISFDRARRKTKSTASDADSDLSADFMQDALSLETAGARRTNADVQNDAEIQVSAMESTESSQPTLKSTKNSVRQVKVRADENKDPATSALSKDPKTSKSTKSSLVTVAKNKQAAQQHPVQEDIFALPPPEESTDTKRYVKSRRRKSVRYNEGDTSGQDSSGSEFVQSPRKSKSSSSRARPTHTTSRKDPKGSSSTKNVRNTRSHQSKTAVQPAQPLEKSLLSNLQPRSNAGQGQLSTFAAEPKGKEAVTNKARIADTTISSRINVDSELKSLSKLNDVENDGELENRAPSKKRSLPLDSVSTPPRSSKRARTDDDGPDIKARMRPSISTQNTHIVQPVKAAEGSIRATEQRVPCGRESGVMQAPPVPHAEDFKLASSARRQRRAPCSLSQTLERQTPVNQLNRRSHSGMSANAEIFSSNSKPTPASPSAESTAISGHADRHDVNREKAIGEYHIEKSDPFRSNVQKMSDFTRRLTGDRAASEVEHDLSGSQENPAEVENSPGPDLTSPIVQAPKLNASRNELSQSDKGESPHVQDRSRRSRNRRTLSPSAIEPADSPIPRSRRVRKSPSVIVDAQMFPNDAEMEGETLVDLEQLATTTTTPAHLKSSPPGMGHSTSSHSSTSLGTEPRTDPYEPASEAEEVEWERSLKPYQRNLHDQLLRVSNKVLRHIVDNESAVDDITEAYGQDGQHTLQLLLDSHQEKLEIVRKDTSQKKAATNKAAQQMLSKLKKQREGVMDDATSLPE